MARSSRSYRVLPPVDGFEQCFDPAPVLDAAVELEDQLRRMAQLYAPAELRTKEALAARKRGERILLLFVAAQHAQEDLSLRQVVRDFNAGYRDEADPRILQFLLDDLAEFFFDLFADSAYTDFRHC